MRHQQPRQRGEESRRAALGILKKNRQYSGCATRAPHSQANSLLELEHSSRQVALTGIGENGHDGLALVLGTLRELTRSPHGSTR